MLGGIVGADGTVTGPAEGDYGHGVPEELQPLLERRDAAEVIAERDRMIDEITAELSGIVPGSRFVPRREPGESVCGDFGSTDGSSYFSPHYPSPAPISAALWDRGRARRRRHRRPVRLYRRPAHRGRHR